MRLELGARRGREKWEMMSRFERGSAPSDGELAFICIYENGLGIMFFRGAQVQLDGIDLFAELGSLIPNVSLSVEITSSVL